MKVAKFISHGVTEIVTLSENKFSQKFKKYFENFPAKISSPKN